MIMYVTWYAPTASFQYRVSRLFVEKTATVISRGFQLQHIPSGQEREITHLQYIDWPDYGIPDDPQPFLSMLNTCT